MGVINMDNLFEKALKWYKKGGDYKRAACELFSEKELENEIDKCEKERRENLVKDRNKMLQEMLIRCKKLFRVGCLIRSDHDYDSDYLRLIISEPYIQDVNYLPFCVDYSWEYKDGEKRTIVVDTIGIWRNEPLGKSQVCLEELLYYMDKPDGDNFKKKGLIDLKEYAENQIEKKDKELKNLKEKEQKVQKDLSKLQMEIATLEAYNPSELTEQKLKEILKDVTETN